MHKFNHAINLELDSCSPTPVTQYQLSASTSHALLGCLEDDSVDYYYSSACTYLESISGLYAGNFAWSTVRLYYSCFYSARAVLGANNIAVFYRGKKPYSISVSQGNVPRKESGTSHEVVFNVISRSISIPELMQPIDAIPPFEWLKERREEANYKVSKIYDPNMPFHFNHTSSESISRSISAYINEIERGETILTHDKYHAAVAYPLLCLRKAKDRLRSKGHFISEPDISYLLSITPEPTQELANFLFQ